MPEPRKVNPAGVVWGVILIGFVVMFLSSSIKGTYQIYFRDLADFFGVGRGAFALSGALFGLSLGLFSPVVGAVCDRYGPYLCLLSGGAVASLAFFLLGNVTEYGVFLFAYGILAAYALAALSFVPVGILIDRVISRQRKGLAFAAVSNGVAIGFIVLSPLWVWLNNWMTWSDLSNYLAIVFAVLITIPVLLVSRAFPVPGDTSASGQNENSDKVSEHLKKPLFLLLAMSFAGCGASMAFIDIHLVPLVQERTLSLGGEGTSTVALMLSVLGLFELIGAVVVGYVAGKLNVSRLLAMLYGVRALSLAMLAVTHSPALFILFAVLFGLTYMGTVILTSMICLNCYGPKIKGKMFGLLFSVHQVAVFLTAWLGGFARDATGDYTLTTLAVTSVCLLSLFAALSLKGIRTGQSNLAAEPEPT
ncbi:MULTISPECIES: MFS transporter [Marinobacter]|uniref:MFS transporter n=1 Tax=Marinobacter TaxID=2742 RepID=UPI001246EF48|nr:MULTISPECIES: MFS transporter [Marinobacter]MBL3555260.1 MFS transporter [Marinobacter sp. JB05H06]